MYNYIWNHYGVKELDYNELVRKIWGAAFNNESILEPLENLEMRITSGFKCHIDLTKSILHVGSNGNSDSLCACQVCSK